MKRDMAQHLKTILVIDELICKQVTVVNEVLFVPLIHTDREQYVKPITNICLTLAVIR